eukprot:TRINITY_DN1593_c0_g1_i1.p3 TRINITY_DN1593_c0_g1~~TRINITY_DN1593_c0_g1_i1.p3  ORF type:complete len:119 (-),score=47.03 TRINITY_DN1593_c0_g1_i1:708-1064(-)
MSFASDAVFSSIAKAVEKDGETLVKKIKGVFKYEITNSTGDKKVWVVNLKEGSGSVAEADGAADCTISIKDEDFVSLVNGKLNAQMAFMQGKLKLKGNIMLAQKLETLFSALRPKSKL